jgi:type I restriction enzyme S subunit
MKRPVARANINLDEIGTLPIPLPPLEKQYEIAEHIRTIRQKAKQLQQDGACILADAKIQVEQMILG